MSVSEVLRAAQARIDTPEKWRCGWNYVDGGYCALTAFDPWTGADDPVYRAVETLARVMGGRLPGLVIPRFNDSHTHAEVMAAFSEAVAIAEAVEQEFTVEALELEPVA